MKLTEDLLHFIWRYQLFNALDLRTTRGDKLRIISYGQYNTDAGPDFEHAQILLNDTKWSGHIEMHIKSSDWTLHQHQLDPVYNSTILHVIWYDDVEEVLREDGTKIPTLNLQTYRFDDSLEKYKTLMESLHAIPCHVHIQGINPLIIANWIDRMLIERLQNKYDNYRAWISQTNGDWERIFLISLGRAMGMRVNGDSFEELVRRLPITLLRKYSDDSLKIEALVFGIAGFLSIEPIDEYMGAIKDEFTYLQKIHQLMPMDVVNWKFMRMRPMNFPTIRLAQLAALLQANSNWFSNIIESVSLDAWQQQLKLAKINPYWESHYRFGVTTTNHQIRWSKGFLEHISINAIVPSLYAYGVFTNNEQYMQRAISWMQGIPVENNAYIRQYTSLGLAIRSANDSQALLHLHRNYCLPRKCLQCAVGLQIIK